MLASAAATNWRRGGPAVESETGPRPVKSRKNDSTGLSATDELSEQRRTPGREEKLQEVLATAKERLGALSTYQVNITRTERVGGQMQPEEEVVLSIRRNPKAVRLEWAKGPSKGREVIYSAALNDRMMYVNSGNSALPLPRMTIPVDSPLALRNSRHPITEAGFDTILNNLFKFLEPKTAAARQRRETSLQGYRPAQGAGPALSSGGASYTQGRNLASLPGYPIRSCPPWSRRSRLPAATLIERYTYRNLKPNPTELASNDAFDPDKRWGESKGWLSRIARAAGTPADANSRQSTTR